MIRRDGLVAGLLGAAAASLYLSFTTKFYVFEGLARAMPIAAGRFYDTFLGNYLLYGFLGWCFHHLLGLFGPEPLSVVSLQIMDCLIGAGGVSLFYLTLRRLDFDRVAAALWSVVLSVCLGYWLWSCDAQNYIFSTFVLGLNFHFLTRDSAGPRVPPALLGALQALAILGHIINGLFGIVGLWHLRRIYGKNWGRPAAIYFAAAAAGAIGAYALVLGLVVKPATAAAAFHWFYGSLNRGGGGLRWHGQYDWLSLRTWMKMTVNIVASFAPPYRFASGGAAAEAFLAAARGLALVFAVRLLWKLSALKGARREAAWICLSWLAVYGAMFSNWEPMTMVYRVSDLVPIVALFALGAEAGPSPKNWRFAAAAFAGCLCAGNFLGDVYPRSIAENNLLLQRMFFVRDATPPDAWVASPESQGGGEELYLPFFARRSPILLTVYRDRPEDLKARLDALLGRGEPVFVTSVVRGDPFWLEFFRPYRPAFQARDPEGFELYRLAVPGRRGAAEGRGSFGATARSAARSSPKRSRARPSPRR